MGWSEWKDLGGETPSAPAAWTHQGVTYLIVRGMDNRLWERTSSDGENFTGWAPHEDGLTDASPVLVELEGKLHVLVRGLDGGVWIKRMNNGAWQRFAPLGGQILDEPAAAPGQAVDVLASGQRVLRDTQEILVRGLDGVLYQGIWSYPEMLSEEYPQGAVRIRNFAGAATPDIVARGQDNVLRHWRGQLEVHSDSPILGSTPVIDSRGGDHRHVFVRGMAGQVLQRIHVGPGGYQPTRAYQAPIFAPPCFPTTPRPPRPRWTMVHGATDAPCRQSAAGCFLGSRISTNSSAAVGWKAKVRCAHRGLSPSLWWISIASGTLTINQQNFYQSQKLSAVGGVSMTG